MIIPDFGGFIIKSSPAQYSSQHSEFYPPSAVTQFHTHLKNNDGLLIQSIMNAADCSYEEAAGIVADFVSNRNQELKETKSTILPGIGKIYLDQEDCVNFKANRDSNFNQESFGLSVLSAKKVNREEKVERAVQQEITKRKRNPIALTFTAAASIVALLLATSLFFLHQGNQNQQEFLRANLTDWFTPVIENLEESKNISPENQIIPPPENKYDSPSINEPLETSTESETDTSELKTESQKIPTVRTESADFHVVIGMFEKQTNAQNRYQEALDLGYENVVLKRGRKYYRVVIPYSVKHATWTEAVDELRSTIEPEAWIWETLFL